MYHVDCEICWINNNNKNDDYLMHSYPLDLCIFMKFEYMTWSKREQRVWKLWCSIHFVHAVYTVKYLADLAQVRVLLALNQVTQFIHFYHKVLHFFNEYDTNLNCNNCVSQNICLMCCLLNFNKIFYPIKHILKRYPTFVFVYIV